MSNNKLFDYSTKMLSKEDLIRSHQKRCIKYKGNIKCECAMTISGAVSTAFKYSLKKQDHNYFVQYSDKEIPLVFGKVIRETLSICRMCAARNEYFYNKLVREEETKLRSPNVTVIANRLTRSKKKRTLDTINMDASRTCGIFELSSFSAIEKIYTNNCQHCTNHDCPLHMTNVDNKGACIIIYFVCECLQHKTQLRLSKTTKYGQAILDRKLFSAAIVSPISLARLDEFLSLTDICTNSNRNKRNMMHDACELLTQMAQEMMNDCRKILYSKNITGSIDTRWKQPQKRGKRAPYCTTSFIGGDERFVLFCKNVSIEEIYDKKTKKYYFFEKMNETTPTQKNSLRETEIETFIQQYLKNNQNMEDFDYTAFEEFISKTSKSETQSPKKKKVDIMGMSFEDARLQLLHEKNNNRSTWLKMNQSEIKKRLQMLGLIQSGRKSDQMKRLDEALEHGIDRSAYERSPYFPYEIEMLFINHYNWSRQNPDLYFTLNKNSMIVILPLEILELIFTFIAVWDKRGVHNKMGSWLELNHEDSRDEMQPIKCIEKFA